MNDVYKEHELILVWYFNLTAVFVQQDILNFILNDITCLIADWNLRIWWCGRYVVVGCRALQEVGENCNWL